MAMVLDAFASYLGDLLKQVAAEELGTMLGVSGEIYKMGAKLDDLKNLLADAERRRITDQRVQLWVTELKRTMYEATDILDLCQLKAMERGSPTPDDAGCCNPLLFCLRSPLFAHEVGDRIKKLNQSLDAIKERSAAFSFLDLGSYDDRRVAQPSAAYRKTDPVLGRSVVVGEKIEEDTRALVERLKNKNDNDNPVLVAIVGVGGIGKTTLAKKVFNDEAIEQWFTMKIWMSVTKEFSEVELLKTAITTAKGNLPEGGTQDKSLLVPALVSTIRDNKVFLVLDDMWGDNVWNNLLKAPFSYGAPGSRILVTTRHEKVARGLQAVHPYHHVDKLGPEDAWTLLKKQVLTAEESEPAIHTLKDIGLKIIEKCDGLPLAIKVMGGLLRQREKEQHDWEKVLNDAIWSVSQMPDELNYALYLSYDDLSPCLKQCFLHFSLKPKKMILNDRQFVGMWISEGFVHGDSDRLEELGIEYHKELILRNLIEPNILYAGQYICNMHDVVRSFAQYVTRDEALVTLSGETGNAKLSLRRFLRLSIEAKGVESDEFEWRSLQDQKSLRMLLLTGNFKIQPGDSLITFSSLQTLHVESRKFSALVGSLYLLKHLRYLTVNNCDDIHSLPENIQKMKFLQHISVDGCENLVKLPDSIVKLRELRFLDLDNTCVNSMPRGFCALTNLRTLYGFLAHVDGDWCSLEELGPLSQLISLGLRGLENVPLASSAMEARLDEKMHLTTLSLHCKSRLGDDGLVKGRVSAEEEQTIEEVFGELNPLPCLEHLTIHGYFGRQLPKWMMSTTMTPLQNLKILLMHDLACCTRLPDGLCQLPCLEFLQVDRAPVIKSIGPEFVEPYNDRHHHNTSMVVAAFPRLHKMFFKGMVKWDEWEWEEEVQAMPVLEDLFIQDCKLGHIPPSLASHARALKKLSIWSVKRLHSLENFPSITELYLRDLPKLTKISSFPKLQKLEINRCRNLQSLQEMTALKRLVLKDDYFMEELPSYLQSVQPRHLLLECGIELLSSMAAGKSGPEWAKFSHIQHVEAYADDVDDEKQWHIFYTSEPYNMETNIKPILQVAVKVGPWGASSGTPCDISSYNKPQRLESITICSSESRNGCIFGLSFVYVDEKGEHINVGTWGSTNPGYTNMILMGRGEHLNHVSGTTDDSGITSLKLASNRCDYGPYGYPAGAAFSLPLQHGKGQVVAFFGLSGDAQLKALGVYVPGNKEESPVKVGPWGANTCAPRDINLRNKPNKLQSFTVCSTESSGGRIHGFSFMYADKNGQLINVGPWGTRFSRGDARTFPMTRGEYVNHISGTTDDYGVTSLKLSTNLGSEYGPFGCPAGPAFSMPLPENGNGAVVAFFGRAGESLIAIGAYISVAPPEDDA